MDLVLVMHYHLHPQSIVVVKLQCIIFSERGMLYNHSFCFKNCSLLHQSIGLHFAVHIYQFLTSHCTWHLDLKELRYCRYVPINVCVLSYLKPLHFTTKSNILVNISLCYAYLAYYSHNSSRYSYWCYQFSCLLLLQIKTD